MIDYNETPKCRRCGVTGWECFSWDGYCLMCEDDENGATQLDDLEEDEL